MKENVFTNSTLLKSQPRKKHRKVSVGVREGEERVDEARNSQKSFCKTAAVCRYEDGDRTIDLSHDQSQRHQKHSTAPDKECFLSGTKKMKCVQKMLGGF